MDEPVFPGGEVRAQVSPDETVFRLTDVQRWVTASWAQSELDPRIPRAVHRVQAGAVGAMLKRVSEMACLSPVSACRAANTTASLGSGTVTF